MYGIIYVIGKWVLSAGEAGCTEDRVKMYNADENGMLKTIHMVLRSKLDAMISDRTVNSL